MRLLGGGFVLSTDKNQKSILYPTVPFTAL